MWRVSGLIVGWMLPAEPRTILGVTIAPLAQPRWTRDRTIGLNIEPAPGIKGTSILGLEPAVGFMAYHHISVEANAESQQEAEMAAREQFEIVAAIVSIAGAHNEPGPVISVEESENFGEPGAAPQPSHLIGRQAALIINDSDATNIGALTDLEGLAQNDPAGRNLLGSWAKAERDYFLSFTNWDRARALISYSVVMETVGEAVAADSNVDPAVIEKQLEENLATLREALNDGALSLKVRNLALNTAAQRLREVRGQTPGQRMRVAGERIGFENTRTKRRRDAMGAEKP
jgi:hypothetical protein